MVVPACPPTTGTSIVLNVDGLHLGDEGACMGDIKRRDSEEAALGRKCVGGG
eukprot:SAG11_NODE_1825_length_4203_cov_3.238304_2_plen_52_part_00